MRLKWFLLAALLSAPAYAQRGNAVSQGTPFIPACTAITGNCPANNYVCISGGTALYQCVLPGTWTQISGGGSVSVDGVAASSPDIRSDGDIDAIRCTGAGAPDASCPAAEDVLFRYNAGSIVNADISASAAIAASKLATEVVVESETVLITETSPAAGHILVYDGTNSYDNKAISGHATLSSTGAVRVTNKAAECFTLYDVDGLADTNDLPSVWRAPAAITVTEVWAETDAGAPAINLQRDDGTPADVLSSNLTPTTGGATGTIDLAEDNFADGDRLDFVMVTASTAKRINVCVEYTYD